MSNELLGAFPDITLRGAVMIAIALGMIYLGVARKYEPLLLLPIGFGVGPRAGCGDFGRQKG